VRQRIRGTPRCAILHVALARRHVYASGGRVFEARPDTAMLLAPGEEFTLYSEPDDCLIALRLPESRLEDELRKRDPDRGGTPETACEVPLRPAGLATLSALHRALVAATGRHTPDAAAHARQLVARLCGWVADQRLALRPAAGGRTPGSARIRLVEEWIDAHLADPITLGRLCAIAGVGDRWLEAAFRAHRGQTPLQFVTGRRMAWVRRRLLEARGSVSVTQLAHDAGFVHLGRFAARYRSAYGESPSTTAKRGARRS
jgi:AraC-like DNA-binding protein